MLHHLSAVFYGALSVRIPLSHNAEDLRYGRLRPDQQLQALEAAQVEESRFALGALDAQWSLGRRMHLGPIPLFLQHILDLN